MRDMSKNPESNYPPTHTQTITTHIFCKDRELKSRQLQLNPRLDTRLTTNPRKPTSIPKVIRVNIYNYSNTHLLSVQ